LDSIKLDLRRKLVVRMEGWWKWLGAVFRGRLWYYWVWYLRSFRHFIFIRRHITV